MKNGCGCVCKWGIYTHGDFGRDNQDERIDLYIYIGVFHGCPIYFRYQNTFGVRNGKRLATRMCTQGDWNRKVLHLKWFQELQEPKTGIWFDSTNNNIWEIAWCNYESNWTILDILAQKNRLKTNISVWGSLWILTTMYYQCFVPYVF
jgi:hypothetical protein